MSRAVRRAGEGVVVLRNGNKGALDDLTEPEAVGLRLYAQLGLRVPAELALQLRRYCQGSGKSANMAVMEALVQYLGANGRPNAR